MATFTIRATEEEEEALQEFMEAKGFASKSKAVIWLIENGLNLCESHEKLKYISENKEVIETEEKIIALHKEKGLTKEQQIMIAEIGFELFKDIIIKKIRTM